MSDISLTIATGPYDRITPLRVGEIKPEGIVLKYHTQIPVHGIFIEMAEREAWDVSEMSLALYIVKRVRALEGGEPFPFTAIPIFPSRVFRHGNIFKNINAGITGPKDLEGKRIGIQEYRQSAGIWIRGILRDQYDVDTSFIEWVEGGVNEPRKPATSDVRPNQAVNINELESAHTLSEALESGEIDAIIAARQPNSSMTSEYVVRLIPNYREVEKDYFVTTGIFPIMHTLVIRDAVYNESPWVSKSLFNAFDASKSRALEILKYTGALTSMAPWIHDELNEMNTIFGEDPWPYGLDCNRGQLEIFTRYLVEEGFLNSQPPLDDIFADVN